MSEQDSQSPYCFCELAPLYVLGSLEDPERQWVEAQMQTDPDLAAEIAEYETAIATLPYAIPRQSLPTGLKERVFRQTTGEAPPTAQAMPSVPYVGKNFNFDHLRWRPFNASGFEMAKLHLDRDTRELSCLVRAAAGGLPYPAHRHAGPEEILMLEGELRIGETLYGPGDYIRSDTDSVHPKAVSVTACLFFLKTSVDNEVLV
ncbi:cupin domain-containing protein [Acaryochloris sp. IP29b_bin.137]|uniref:cupin domain-containing protein n=1 Tax=Acaryochloris sp. IP29b_bin.137 TaxID=2969217 RepID=UPI0026017B66|nr:cupin domain-containing protein [Acaryochloris sp. IP29b_bin.137]